MRTPERSRSSAPGSQRRSPGRSQPPCSTRTAPADQQLQQHTDTSEQTSGSPPASLVRSGGGKNGGEIFQSLSDSAVSEALKYLGTSRSPPAGAQGTQAENHCFDLNLGGQSSPGVVPACVTRAFNSEILHVCERPQKNLSSDSFSMISGTQAKTESLSGSPPAGVISTTLSLSGSPPAEGQRRKQFTRSSRCRRVPPGAQSLHSEHSRSKLCTNKGGAIAKIFQRCPRPSRRIA